MMEKRPFVSLEQIQEMAEKFPTPFHLYDEKGIRENARKLHQAFAWNPGFKEYFAVKATPNPFILKILKEEGCGLFVGYGTDAVRGLRVFGKGDYVFFQ